MLFLPFSVTMAAKQKKKKLKQNTDDGISLLSTFVTLSSRSFTSQSQTALMLLTLGCGQQILALTFTLIDEENRQRLFDPRYLLVYQLTAPHYARAQQGIQNCIFCSLSYKGSTVVVCLLYFTIVYHTSKFVYAEKFVFKPKTSHAVMFGSSWLGWLDVCGKIFYRHTTDLLKIKL